MSNGFVDAVRKNSRILAGLSGPTGSGKTYSALRLATGLAQGGIIAYIDTERGRALDYADTFAFKYVELDEPFTPARYIEKFDEAEALNPAVVIVDSASHEWAGVGGCTDIHDAVVDRMAGDDYKKREAVSWGAWNKPKQEDRRFVNRLTRMRPHVIVCLRADEKTEMIDDPDKPGKKKIVPKRLLSGHVGWIPVSGKALPYELTLSLVLTPDRPGVPHAIKLPEPLKPMVPLDSPLSEETGKALAAWAAGTSTAPASPKPKPGPQTLTDDQIHEVVSLCSRLLQHGDETGKRAETQEAINKNAAKNDPAVHLDWLREQVRKLDAKLAAA